MTTPMRIFIILATTTIFLKFAAGTDHMIGAPNGSWNFFTDYKAWASSQKFTVGDTITFTYISSLHNVLEVSEADYYSCSTSSPINMYTGGLTAIYLNTPGQRYFICGVLRHCLAGMKIEIDTLEGSTTPSPSTPPPVMEPVAAPLRQPSASSIPSFPHTKTNPAASPPRPSSANKYTIQASITMGVGLALVMLLAL